MNTNFSFYFLKREPSIKSDSPPLLLMMHGYGSNEADLFSFAEELDPRLLIISIRAPQQLGPHQFQWFALKYSKEVIDADLEQAQKSCEQIIKFIDEVITEYKVDAKKIFLLGFSQGAMISLHTALVFPEKINSAIILSGRFTSITFEKKKSDSELKHLKIFMVHGLHDEVIPITRARDSKLLLEKLPIELTYKEYNMGHWIDNDSFRDFSIWLSSKIDN